MVPCSTVTILEGNASPPTYPLLIYYYIISCTRPVTELDGPLSMSVHVDGDYGNSAVSWFGHSVESRAEAFGYQNMPDVFDADCHEEDVPFSLGADFECDLYWELVGYNDD